jgi:hypothetical protein
VKEKARDLLSAAYVQTRKEEVDRKQLERDQEKQTGELVDAFRDRQKLLVEQRASRVALTKEFDERGVEALQRTSRRAYNRAGDFITDALNRGQLTPAEAESLNQNASREYATRLREVLDAKSKLKDVDQSYLDDLRDEITYYDRLGVALSNTDRFMRGFKSQIESTGDAFDRLGSNIAQSFTNLKTLLGSLGSAFKTFFNDLLSQSLQRFAGSVLNPIFGRLGSIIPNGAGVGGVLTPPTFPQGSSVSSMIAASTGSLLSESTLSSLDTITGRAQINGGLQQVLNSGTSTAVSAAIGSKFNLSSIGKSLGAALPFLGLSIGGSLGGKSTAGSILGSVGGCGFL